LPPFGPDFPTQEVFMVSLLSLWLPIVLSAALVFVVSSLVHMLLPWHKNDLRRLAKEAEVMAALRPFAIPPGDYAMPLAGSMTDMKSPEFAARMKEGPVAFLTVAPSGSPSMTGPMVQWFLYSLLVSVFAAYIAGHALPAGAPFRAVLRFAGCTAFLGYSLALMQHSIWYRRNWGVTLKSMLDGLLYGLVTGAVLGWFWPR
jgi:hypothetical protein